VKGEMVKKISAIVLATALSISLAACSNSDSKQTDGASNQQSGGGTAKPVEITFWDMAWGPAQYIDTAKKLVDTFNSEHPNIKVTYQSIPWDNNWYQTFANAIAAGSPPDISTGAGYQAFQFYDSDQILPIDDVITDLQKSGKLDDFNPGSVDALKYKGHYVALPWMLDLRIPYYRKDIFANAGITPPKTWDELRADLKKLTGNGKYGMVVGGNDTSGVHVMFTLMENNGGGLFTADKKTDLMNARNVEALQYLSDLYKDGVINPASAGFTKDQVLKDFGTGQSAVFINVPGITDRLPDIKDKIGIIEPLAGPHGEKATLGWVNNIMIYKQTKHPNETKEFLKWWSENQKPLFTEGKAGGLPARKSFAQDAMYQNDPILKVIVNQYLPILKTTGNHYPSGFPELNQIEGDGSMLQLVQQILTGKPVQDSMKQADQKLKEIMKENE
jgi:multiple sugar transport system substrate-binding protein